MIRVIMANIIIELLMILGIQSDLNNDDDGGCGEDED